MASDAVKRDLRLHWTFEGGFYSLDSDSVVLGSLGVVYQSAVGFSVTICLPLGGYAYALDTNAFRACRYLASRVAELYGAADIGAPAGVGEE